VTRYISLGEWFQAGTEATLIDDYRPQMNSGLFRGWRICENPGAEGGKPSGQGYEDEEICGFDEFKVEEDGSAPLQD